MLAVASWNFIESLATTDYVQIMWASPDTDVKLIKVDANTTSANIDIPSVSVTVTPVGA